LAITSILTVTIEANKTETQLKILTI